MAHGPLPDNIRPGSQEITMIYRTPPHPQSRWLSPPEEETPKKRSAETGIGKAVLRSWNAS